MSTKILTTTNYARFKIMEGNRPVGKRVNQLIAAITRKNELHLYPIVVHKNGDGHLYVADGQHRLKAAEALKLPISYIETKDISLEDVIRSNAVQKNWSLRDHLTSNANLGNPHYMTLLAFHETYRLPISTCASLLRGGLDQGQAGQKLRTGKFTITPGCIESAKAAGDFILKIKTMFSGATDRGFAIAMERLFRVTGFNPERLLQKLEYQSTKLVKCANWPQYVDLIDEIYNYRSRPQDMIALAMEVKKLKSK